MKLSDMELKALLAANPKLKLQAEKQLAVKAEEESKVSKSVATVKGVPAESKMNKLETRFAHHLEMLKRIGEIVDWKPHPMNLRLSGMKCWYSIDFMVITNDMTIELIETKGKQVWDDALVKFKTASEMFPHFTFVWVTQDRHDSPFKRRRAVSGIWIDKA